MDSAGAAAYLAVMPSDQPAPSPPPSDVEGAAPGKALTPAARRALEEAAARRADADRAKSLVSGLPGGENSEAGGPSGPEPTRYGDWERKGLAVDF